MGRRVVIGTAGHIDHGKTALVKALTGVDTDRWEEEKRRGITIDLGFAPLDLGDGLGASIVDVPGHEGFVRNMLAGATGIDVALLVVAADEGLMPQTEEHLAIIELLGITRGVPVITKRDVVDAEWLELVRSELAARLATSPVHWSEIMVASALTGDGTAELRTTLARSAATTTDRALEDVFRLPIDRVFAVPGAGTVVTGSTWSGTVAVGDTVQLLPSGGAGRVRSIEVHGLSADHAIPGSRTALALVGVDRNAVRRGCVAVTGPGWGATSTLDVHVEMLAAARFPVRPRVRLRVHLGTAEVLARVSQVREIAPGTGGYARLRLEAPLVARAGDRFVLRSFSPVTTVGGGLVLDPFPPSRPRVERRGLAVRQHPGDRLAGLVEEAGLTGLPIASLPVRLGVRPPEGHGIIESLAQRVVRIGDTLLSSDVAQHAVAQLRDGLRRHHDANPLDPGMPLQALRGTLPDAVLPAVWDALLALGQRTAMLQVEAGTARLPGWKPHLDRVARTAREGLLHQLSQAHWRILTLNELEQAFPEAPVRPLLAQLVREGSVEQVGSQHFAVRAALAAFSVALETALRDLGTATPAQLRDRFGLTRKYLIPLLEWADRRGLTRRVGVARELGSA